MACSELQKVTTMVLKVDLECCQCYKKVKKVLCKFPQIRDQLYDKKQNTVTITVICCSPEKIRDKLCCKGGKSIKSIEIKDKEPKQPDHPEPKPKPKPDDKPKPPRAPVLVPVPVELEKPKPVPAAEPDKPKPKPAPKAPPPAPAPAEQNPPQPDKPAPADLVEKTKPKPKPEPKPKPPEPEAQWVPAYPPCPPPQGFPIAVCCGSCYEGRPGGPCHQGYVPGYGYTYGRPPCYYPSRCDYFNEENPTACSIM